MKIIRLFLLKVFFLILFSSYSYSETFDQWKLNFSKHASQQGVSKSTLSLVINNLKFLPKVIEYDRYQPEFYEDTLTYISKRTNSKKVNIGRKTYLNNSKLINKDLPQDDPKQRRPDITKAKNLLNWEPVVKLEDGLTQTIDWVNSQL